MSLAVVRAQEPLTPEYRSGQINGYRVSLSFNELLDPSIVPPPQAFEISGYASTVRRVSISGTEVRLTVVPPIPEGADAVLTYTAPTTGGIEALDKPSNPVASFSTVSRPLSNNTYGPVVTAISVDADSVLLTFSARVSEEGALTGAEFRFCTSEFESSDACRSATAVVVNDTIVTLTVAEDALPADSVLWFRYSEGSSGARLVDRDSGAPVEAISAHPFSTPAAPVVVDPPSLLSAVGDSGTVTLTFERALDATSAPALGAFTANGSAPSAATLDGPTVTLTLAAALADGESAAVSYTPPEANALQDTEGVRVAAFSTPIENRTDSAPVAVSAAIDASGASLTITFSEALSEEPLHQPASDAFSISGDSTAITAAGVTGTSLILTLGPSVLQGQTLRIAYTAPAEGALRDADQGGLSVAAFELQIENNSELTLAPTPLDTGGLVDAYVITLDFSEPLDPDVVPSPTAFAISGHEAQVHAVSVVGAKVLLQVLPPVAPDLFPSISYSPAQSGALESLLKPASEVPAFTRELNNTTSGPVVTAIAVEGSAIALSFSAPLRAKGTILSAAFRICPAANADDDDCAAATMLAVDGAVVTLTAPAEALPADTEVWLRYSGGSDSDHLHDQYNSSAIVPAIAGHPFRTPAATPTPPALLTAIGDGAMVTLTFDGDLDAGSVPTVAAFSLNGAAPSEVLLDGAVVTLTLAAGLADGEAASVSYTPPEEGALQGADGIAAAAFTQAIVNRTDHAPVAESGEVNAAGATLTITFSESLSAASDATPAITAFSLTGTSAAVSVVTVSGAAVTLSLSPVALAGDSISVDYTPPIDAPRLRDKDQGALAVATFSLVIDNGALGPPMVLSAVADGAAVELRFDRDLDTGAVPAPAAFSVENSAVIDVTLDAAVVTLTLATALADGEEASATYTPPNSVGLQDAHGNAVAAFTTAIDNRTDDAPLAKTAEIDVTGATLTITFSEGLSELTDSAPPASAFSLAGTSATATSVSIEASVVTLQLSPAAREGDSIVLSYDLPSAGGLADADQGRIPVAMFSLIVSNRTDTAPVPQHGTVADDLITLTFDQLLDETSVPPVIEQGLSPSNAITVAVDQIRVSFTTVAVDGRELRLTLASPVRAGAQVRVQYQLGTASPLGDTSMPPNLMDSFDPFQLTNVTSAAPLSAEIVGWTLRVTFDAPLMPSDAIGTAGFDVAADASAVAVHGISANGAVLVLRIATPVATGVAVTLTYEPPFEAALLNADGSAVRAFALIVGNLTDDGPLAAMATVDGTAVAIEFDRDLIADPTLSAGAFEANGRSGSAVAVEDKVLRITLAEAVAEASDVEVAYTPSSPGVLRDVNGIAVSAFALEATNLTDTAPVVTGVFATARLVTVSFDQALSTGGMPPLAAFHVEGASANVSGVGISGATLQLTLGCCLDAEADPSLVYTPQATDELEDLTGNDVAAFTHPIDNRTVAGPGLESAVVQGRELRLTFGAELDGGSTVLADSFGVTVDGSDVAIESVAVDRNDLVVTLNQWVAGHYAVTITYTPSDDGTLRGVDGGYVRGIDERTVENRSAPRLESVEADGTRLTLTFDTALRADTPSAGVFSVPGANVASVAISAQTVVLTLSDAVVEGQAIGISYQPVAVLQDAIVGANGVVAEGFEARAVLNLTDTPPVPTGARVIGAALTIAFDQTLDSSGVPPDTAFTVAVDGLTIGVSEASIGEDSVALTLEREVTAAEAVAVAYTQPDAAGLADATGNDTLSFELDAENLTAPELALAEVNGGELTLTFDAALDPASRPGSEAFTVHFATIVGVTVLGDVVTLALNPQVAEDASVTLFYEPPGDPTKRLQSAHGAEVEAIPGFAVRNLTDTVPVVVSAGLQEAFVTLAFDQALETSVNPNPDAFSLAGSDRHAIAATLRNDAVTSHGVVAVTLDGSVTEGAEIAVAYRPQMAATDLRDPEGNEVAAFDVVAENATDTAPDALSGVVDGTAAAITFDQALGMLSPDATAFRMTGTLAVVTSLEIAGATLMLTLQPPVKEGETVTLEYTEPELSPLQDATANRVVGFERVLVNRTDTTPRVEAATANRSALLIVFDQRLDEGSTPGSEAFSLADGPLVSDVDIDGAVLHLTLEPRAGDGDEMRVTYLGASDHPLQDATLNAVEPFVIHVVNETDDAPAALSASTDMSGATITIVTSESVLVADSVALDAFALVGSAARVASIEPTEGGLSLELEPPVHELDQLVLRYAPDSTQPLLLDADQGALPVAAFELAVDNVADAAPLLEGLTVDGDTLTLTFDQPLLGTDGPPYLAEFDDGTVVDPPVPIHAYRVVVNEALEPAAFGASEVHDRVARLTLLAPVRISDVVTLQYQLQTTRPLIDPTGHEVASFDPRPVENITAAAAVSALVDGAVLTIRFDAALREGGDVDASAFAVNQSAPPAAAASGAVLTLTLSAPVGEGEEVTARYIQPADAALLDSAGGRVKSFELAVDNKTDTAPTVVSALVAATSVEIRFDQELSPTATPATAFSVSDSEGRIAVDSVAVSVRAVSLSLARSAEEAAVVRIAYSRPPTEALADQTSNLVEAFSITAENRTLQGPRPVLVESWLTELVVTFDEPLDPTALPAAEDFELSWAPDVAEVVAIDGAILRLRLHEPGAGPDSRIRLKYEPGANHPLRDRLGTAADSFAIDVADRGSAPQMLSAIAFNRIVLIYFDAPLDAGRVPPLSWWLVMADTQVDVVEVFVSRSGNATLLLKEPGLPEGGDEVFVAYLPGNSGSRSLRGLAGHLVAGSGVLAPNYTQLDPVAVAATASATIVEVRFSEVIAPYATEPDWFAVVAGRRTIGVTGIEWGETSASLTLDSEVTARDAVTLSYEPKSRDGAADDEGRRLAAFSLAATNDLTVAPTPKGRIEAAQLRAEGDPTTPIEVALRRELVREFAWRGGVYATVEVAALNDEALAAFHQDGLPAVVVHSVETAADRHEAQIELRPVTHRALLAGVLDDVSVLAWKADADRATILSAWRIGLSDERGTPIDGRAQLTVLVPLPAATRPLAYVAFDLGADSWQQATVSALCAAQPHSEPAAAPAPPGPDAVAAIDPRDDLETDPCDRLAREAEPDREPAETLEQASPAGETAEPEVDPPTRWIAMRVTAPSLLAIAEMPAYEVSIRPGPTPFVFRGLSGTPAREFASALGPGVIGIGVPTGEPRHWRYIDVAGTWGHPYALSHGERIVIVCDMAAPRVTLTLAADLPLVAGGG